MNIGFSQNKQLTKSQKRRLDMVNFAEGNGINAAVKEFSSTYKTVNLWINRYHREGIAGLADRSRRNVQTSTLSTNRSKSRLTVLKPRNKASFLSADSIISEDKNNKPDPVDDTEKIVQEPPTIPESKKEVITENRLPETVSLQYFDTDRKTIQIGLLNLTEIDGFDDLCQKNDLPSWQFTAFDPQTGGAWISYSYEIDWEKQDEFLKTLTKHFVSNGILPDQINFELCYDSIILNKLGQIDITKTEESLNQLFSGHVVVKNRKSECDSQLNKFHCLIEDNFYYSVRVGKISKLLEKAESFLVQYNYKENFEALLNLPPNQLMCRQYGSNYGPQILRFKPIVLEKNQINKIKYLFGLRMMAGLFTSLTGSVLSRTRRIKRINGVKISRNVSTEKSIKGTVLNALSPKTGVKIASKAQQGAKPVDNKFEYINLKNMNWGKPAVKQTEADSKTNKARNRQELISRAKELLIQKRSIAELKSTLPMTEGELSMLSQNITFSDKERNE